MSQSPVVAAILLVLAGAALAVDLPMLRGELTAAEILARLEPYRTAHAAYTPDETTLRAAGPLPEGFEVVVVFGSWCSDSLDQLPPFIRITEALTLPPDSVRYIAVDRTKQDPNGLTDGLHMERVPTFIFLVQGAEIGRIIETPQETLEKDVRAILRERP